MLPIIQPFRITFPYLKRELFARIDLDISQLKINYAKRS